MAVSKMQLDNILDTLDGTKVFQKLTQVATIKFGTSQVTSWTRPDEIREGFYDQPVQAIKCT